MAEVTFDVDSLTLGEMAAAEQASGLDMTVLMSKTALRLMLVVFVQRLRSSGSAPKWSELQSLRLLDASSLLSGSGPDSPGAKSSD